jgi:hypothetical protein
MINVPRYSTAAPRRPEKRGNILAGLWPVKFSLRAAKARRPTSARHFAGALKLLPGKN